MEKKLILPAHSCVLPEEELVYTEGGGLIGLGLGALYVYNYIWGLSETRNWLKKNKADSVITTSTRATKATVSYMSSTLLNGIRGVITAMQLTALWPITAVAWLSVKNETRQDPEQ